jgi:hypothetical protein
MKKIDNYGCENITSAMPNAYRKLMKQLDVKSILKVPKRRRGLTSSGKPNHCHGNVRMLVDVFGGCEVYGYSLCAMNTTSTQVAFIPHSVWMTPEGKLVEVINTKDEDDAKYIWFEKIIGCTVFAPVSKLYGVSPIGRTDNWSFVVHQNHKECGIFMLTRTGDDFSVEGTMRRFQKGKVVPFTKGFRSKNLRKKERFRRTYWDYDWGGFSKPSISTGKTFKEICAERMVAL